MPKDINERADLISALEFMGKRMPNQNKRAIYNLVSQPDDGTLDGILTKVPAAAAEYLTDNNLDQAAELLNQVNNKLMPLQKARNYGFDIEGHHPIKLNSGWYIGADLPMSEHLILLERARREGLKIGTNKTDMYPLTRLGHELAHLDPLSHKANFKGAYLRDYSQLKPETFDNRLAGFVELGGLEQLFSQAAYESEPEQKVRQEAARLISQKLSNLSSLERDPDFRTPAGRQGRLTYAQTSKKRLDKFLMDKAIYAGWGNREMSMVIQPEDRTISLPPSYQFELRDPRPGQYDTFRKIAKK